MTQAESEKAKAERPMAVTMNWKAGSSTPAWEELWRRIFRDIGLAEKDSTESTVRPTGAPR